MTKIIQYTSLGYHPAYEWHFGVDLIASLPHNVTGIVRVATLEQMRAEGHSGYKQGEYRYFHKINVLNGKVQETLHIVQTSTQTLNLILNLIGMLFRIITAWKQLGSELCAVLFYDYMSHHLHERTCLFALISEEMFSDRIWALWQTKMQMHSVRKHINKSFSRCSRRNSTYIPDQNCWGWKNIVAILNYWNTGAVILQRQCLICILPWCITSTC